MTSFQSITSISFDCYGTLIDWETGICNALAPWVARTGRTLPDDDVLRAFAAAEPAAEEANPTALYRDILRDVMRRLAANFDASCDVDDEDRLANSVGEWPAFDDTAPSLNRLARRCRLFILSNVDQQSIDGTLPKLGAAFTNVITAEAVGAYKPDQRMFDALLATLEEHDIDRAHHLHAAQSLYHDIAPAQRLGLRTCWVDRRAGRDGGATPPPPEGVSPDVVVPNLASLADMFDIA